MSDTITAPSTPPTLAQLRAFIRRRNRSPGNSHEQVVLDAEACGFNIAVFGPATKIPPHEHYRWHLPPHGVLIEQDGTLRLVLDQTSEQNT